MRVALKDRMRRDDLAVRIRHEYPLWRVVESMRQEVYAGEIVLVSTLYIWPDSKVIKKEGMILVRYLWNTVRVEASGIERLIAPNTVVVDAILIVVRDCVEGLIGRNIIARDCMPAS